jgi:hypothetical protein
VIHLPLLLLSLIAGPVQGASAAKPPDLYRRAVARALERAQAELATGLRFDVDHSRWEDPWVVTTPHYEVRTTASYAQAAEVARSLEFMHGEIVKLLGEGRAPAGPRRVWILPSIGEYNRFGEQHGAEHSSMLGCFFAADHPEQPIVSYQNGNATLLGMWLTHGAVHQHLAQGFGPQRELWIEEGLASYFALFWDWSYGARELERIQGTRGFVPLARLVREPLQAYVGQAHERFIELGMLFHFLLNHCEATKNGAAGDPTTGPFQEFLRAAVRGQGVAETEFVQTFEEASELLEQDFKAFPFAK